MKTNILMERIPADALSGAARDHGQNPRHRGELSQSNGHARITGPCGDTIEFWLQAVGGIVTAVSFETDGCACSLAAGSMTACLAKGRAVDEAAELTQQDVLDALGGLPVDAEHCALLASNTLKAACIDYSERSKERGGENHNAARESGAAPNSASGLPLFKDRCSAEQQGKEANVLDRISHKIVVLSGKGGVGKSTIAANLAAALVLEGKRVGLLDVDIHGPSIPTMLGLEGEHVSECDGRLVPVEVGTMKVMSIGFLLKHQDDAVIWRGPMKMNVIKQFLEGVAWEDLDYLIVDCPPGTGDEPLSICQSISGLDGAVIVTTPQKVAAVDVRKSISFCRTLNVAVLGVIENMSGFICPRCGETTPIFSGDAGRMMAEEMHVSFLGTIPFEPEIAKACDNGRFYIQQYRDSKTGREMCRIIQKIAKATQNKRNKEKIQ